MNQKTFSVPAGLLSTLYGVVIVLLGAILHIVPLALAIMAIAELYRAFRRGYLSQAGLTKFAPVWLMGLAAVVFIGLQTQLVTQVTLALAYGIWRWWLMHQAGDSHALQVAGVTELVVLAAIFLSAAIWHVPGLLIVALAWGSSWLIALYALTPGNDRAAPVLIAAWCLIVAETSWLFSLWLVTYIVFNGLLLVPQAALVITALGYCLSGIYLSHRQSQLSRARLIEYLLVGLVLMIVVILGTKWNGVI